MALSYIMSLSTPLGGYYHPHFLDGQTEATNHEVPYRVVSGRARKRAPLKLRIPFPFFFLFFHGPTPSATEIFLNCDFRVNNFLLASKVQAGPSPTLFPGPCRTRTSVVHFSASYSTFSGSVSFWVKWGK